MAKRRAPEDLAAMEGVVSPAPKKRRSQGREDLLNGTVVKPELSLAQAKKEEDEVGAENEMSERDGADTDTDEGEDEDEDERRAVAAPTRQAVPTAGYDDLYLDTINRQVLDFDFEKLCSVSLSNINVYACLVCGRYFQGRGLRSYAYFHALDEDHHVFINMQTQRVYVLPEGYEVLSRSLDDIKFVADPRYTRADVARLDRGEAGKTCFTLTGKPYTPGFVGMNNIKENDYLNVVVQALAHVPPLRNFFLLDEFASTLSSGSSSIKKDAPAKSSAAGPNGAASSTNSNAELVKRFGLLVRKIWNPRAFKAHVSPHELLQEVALRSNRRFTLTAQSDPVDFLTWFLNHLHLGLGGSRTRPGSSIIQRVFQGRVRVESEKLEAVGAAAAAAAAAAASATDATEHVEQQQQSADAMQIDTPLPTRPGPPAAMGGGIVPPLPGPFASQLPAPPPPPGVGAPPSFPPFQQPPPPGVFSSMGGLSAPPAPPPPPGPPGMSIPGSSSTLPPPPSSLPPPPSASSAAAVAETYQPAVSSDSQQPQPPSSPATSSLTLPPPPKPTVDVSRFLLLTLDLPPAPLFQDEQERNIIPQVPLTTLLAKYDGRSGRDQGDVRRRFRLRGPLPPYLMLHMKRFSANKFVTERNPTIVTFDPRGLDMRPYVEDEQGNDLPPRGDEDKDDDGLVYDLVANVVHEAVRARGDDVAVDSAEERRTWKVQLRDRSGATSSSSAAQHADGGQQDRWVVAQDLFVEPVAGELLYLAESYIQIWERRRRPVQGGKAKSKGKAVNGGAAKAR